MGVLLTKNGRKSLNSTKTGTMSLPKPTPRPNAYTILGT